MKEDLEELAARKTVKTDFVFTVAQAIA